MSQTSPIITERKHWHETISDYVLLTKPWIVTLLLITTLGGMLIAAHGMPSVVTLVLTLLGGACAAGGANALNSYIDRDTDKQMGRTLRRPLPSGKIVPRNALLFALILCILSVVILGFGVNWLAALLSAIGIIYYAYVYTVLLKRLTPQNIVIGGGAGAIPPLVGWAAVTNNLNLLSIYLFVIIFFWTPPHTWALMMLVEKDYRKTAIPMLPAAWGETEARRHIILYSILLVVVTIMPVLFHGLSWIYLIGAILLGAYFLFLAARLWRTPKAAKPLARKLYYYSNAYLAMLFALMVVDAILIRA